MTEGFKQYRVELLALERWPVLDWVKLLYSSPIASVHTNSTFYPPFSLCQGTRQGCPLSPLLFILFIEPMAISMHSEAALIGIKLLNTIHKVSLYADDLLLYVSDPIRSFPIILNIIHQYGSVSGYKINYQKGMLLPVNEPARTRSPSIVPFRSLNSSFQYLGIQ